MDDREIDLVVSERRLGKFFVPREVFREGFKRLQLLFACCVPVDMIHIYCRGGAEIVAYSECFDPVEPGAEPPEYDIIFRDIPGGNGRHFNLEFRRKDSAGMEPGAELNHE